MIKPVAGQIYIVAGRGVMLYTTEDNRPRFKQHGNYDLHASASEIVREASAEDLAAYLQQEIPRGLDCKDPECWCVRFR